MPMCNWTIIIDHVTSLVSATHMHCMRKLVIGMHASCTDNHKKAKAIVIAITAKKDVSISCDNRKC